MEILHVIGLGINPDDLPSRLSQIIAQAQVLAGGNRLLEYFTGHPAYKIPLKSPIKKALAQVKEKMALGKKVVVLADGDPGFFGIGNLMVKEFQQENLVFHPNVTTLQTAAARLKIPWQDIPVISFHGRRDPQPLLNALTANKRVAVFTDPDLGPSGIAKMLAQRGVDTFNMYVFEELGRNREQIGSFTLEEAAQSKFSPLNFVILNQTKKPEIKLCLGLDDDLYLHQRSLITKKEIRALSVAALNLQPHHILWDLGAGSGSVGIEASLLLSKGRVLAVERDRQRVIQIKENIKRMGAYGVEIIPNEMPASLKSLPDPDRIFIGGGMGQDNQVILEAMKRLNPDGKIVLNLVLMGSLSRAIDIFTSLKWSFSISQVQVSRGTSMSKDQRLNALNPVFILTAQKDAS